MNEAGKHERTSVKSWSPAFVRNRTETFTLAIILVLLTRISGDITSLPFGFSIQAPIARGPVILFLFGLFLYFLSCWAFRIWIETRDSDLLVEVAKNFTDKSAETLNLLKQKGVAWKDFGFHAGSPKAIDRIAGESAVLDQSISKIKEFADGLAAQIRTFSRANLTQEMKGEFGANMLKENLHAWKAMVEDQGESWSREEAELRRRLREEADEILKHIADATAAAKQEIDRHGPNIQLSLESLGANITQMESRLRKHGDVIGVDRIWFGLVVPLVASIGLVVFAAPQGIKDVKRVMQSAIRCFSDLSCLYRTDRPAEKGTSAPVGSR